MIDSNGKKRRIIFLLFLISIGGMALRIASCFWGYPLELHPDELTIIDSAMDMLRRHSYLAYVYFRPDQFEIKCNAVLFAIASRILFRVPAWEAYETHYMAFILIARGLTAVFGTAMIPLAAHLAGRVVGEKGRKQLTQVLTAVIFAFSPVLVEHSAYATPDVVLTFFILLFALLAQKYLENGKLRDLVFCVVITGLAVTVKYPAAILCIPIAAMVIYRSVTERRPWDILKYGVLSICLLGAVIFAVAPNLFTDFETAFGTLVQQNGPNHLGAAGLGWFGNLRSYISWAVKDLEITSVIAAAAGCLWAIRNPARRVWVLLIGPVYLVCISVLSYHWVQWGIPVYVFYDLLAGIGAAVLADKVRNLKLPDGWRKAVAGLCFVWLAVLGLNLLLSSAGGTKNRITEDTRSVSLKYCIENNITTGNSIYEGYTPLSPNGGAGPRFYAFHMKDGKAAVNEPYATKRYFVTSGSYSGRFLAEKEDYHDQVEIYTAIPESFEEIYRLEGAGGYNRRMLAIKNIPYTVHFFTERYSCTGGNIHIYDLAPKWVAIESAVQPGTGISVSDGKLAVGDTLQSWVLYTRDDGRIVILCAENNQALGHDDEGNLVFVKAEAENECVFEIREQNGAVMLISDGDAVTLRDGLPVLRPLEKNRTAQWWRLVHTETETK